MTLDEFTRQIQSMVRSVGRRFTKPDDDWVPVLFLQTPDGQISTVGLAFDEASKDITEAYVKEQIRSSGAVRYALLNGAWLSPSATLPAEMRIRDLPGAYEMLVLAAGDAETEATWGAKIVRHAHKPPTLAQWAKIEYEGRFTDLASAMRDVR